MSAGQGKRGTIFQAPTRSPSLPPREMRSWAIPRRTAAKPNVKNRCVTCAQGLSGLQGYPSASQRRYDMYSLTGTIFFHFGRVPKRIGCIVNDFGLSALNRLRFNDRSIRNTIRRKKFRRTHIAARPRIRNYVVSFRV
jgi:hypothetical protein